MVFTAPVINLAGKWSCVSLKVTEILHTQAFLLDNRSQLLNTSACVLIEAPLEQFNELTLTRHNTSVASL